MTDPNDISHLDWDFKYDDGEYVSTLPQKMDANLHNLAELTNTIVIVNALDFHAIRKHVVETEEYARYNLDIIQSIFVNPGKVVVIVLGDR